MRWSLFPVGAALAVAVGCSGGQPAARSAAAPRPAAASPSSAMVTARPATAGAAGVRNQELPGNLTWLNAGGASSLASLRGQVVYLQFAFLH